MKTGFWIISGRTINLFVTPQVSLIVSLRIRAME